MAFSEQLKDNAFLYIMGRVIVGGTFIYAAIPKVLNPADFIIQIENYRLVPEMVSYYLGLFLPWLELYCGLFILAGLRTKTNAIIAGILLAVFIAAMSSALIRGLDIECGCFIVASQASPVSLLRILEDVILLLLAISIVKNNKPLFELETYLKMKRT